VVDAQHKSSWGTGERASTLGRLQDWGIIGVQDRGAQCNAKVEIEARTVVAR
jgi:hypothetical protein